MADSREVAQRYADLFMQRFSQIDETEWRHKYSMSYNNVFNITQTDFKEKRPDQYQKLEEAVRKEVQTTVECSFAAFDEAISKGEWLCPVTLNDGDRAYFSPGEDRIVVPRKENFPDQRDFYGTLGHEMVHSTGTKDRLDREMGGFFGSAEYAHEELVAELGSAILSSTTGIQSGIREDNLQYLKSWAQAIGDDPGVITRAVTQAASAADLIDSTLHLSERQEKTIDIKAIIPDLEKLDAKLDNNVQEQRRTENRGMRV